MEIIVRKGRKYAGEYKVYTLEEAEAEGLEPVYWKEADTPGEWVRTDDDMVCQLLDIRNYRETRPGSRRRHPFMTFPMCRLWRTRPARFNLNEFSETTGNWHTHPDQTKERQTAREQKTKDFVQLYVRMLVSGHIDWLKLGYLYSPTSKNPAYWAKKLIKNPEVLEMVRDELRKIFERNGVNEGTVINVFTAAIDIAKKEEDTSNMIKAGVELAKMLDMYPEKDSRANTLGEYGDAMEVDVDSMLEGVHDDTKPKGELPPTPVPEVLDEEEFGTGSGEGSSTNSDQLLRSGADA